MYFKINLPHNLAYIHIVASGENLKSLVRVQQRSDFENIK